MKKTVLAYNIVFIGFLFIKVLTLKKVLYITAIFLFVLLQNIFKVQLLYLNFLYIST